MKRTLALITLSVLSFCPFWYSLAGCTSPQGKEANPIQKASKQTPLGGSSQAHLEQSPSPYKNPSSYRTKSFSTPSRSMPYRIRGVRWGGIGAGALGAAGGAYLLYKKDQDLINSSRPSSSLGGQAKESLIAPETAVPKTPQEDISSSISAQPAPTPWYQQGITQEQRTLQKLHE